MDLFELHCNYYISSMKDFMESSTIHGVTHVKKAENKLLKLFWIFLIICGAGGIIINIIIVCTKYFTYPVTVSITFEEQFTWPEFTFCNPSSLFYEEENSSHSIYRNQILKKSKDKVKESHFQSYDYEIDMASLNIKRLDMGLGNYLKYFKIIEENQIRFDESDYFHNDRKFPDFEGLITDRAVSIRYNTPCYTLNLNNTHKQENKIKQLKLAFNMYYTSHDSRNIFYRLKSLYLFIKNKNEMPNGRPHILSPGSKYTLDISQKRYYHTGSKTSCRKDNFTIELYDFSLKSSKVYEGNYEDCARINMQQYIFKNCNCYLILLPKPKIGEGPPILCSNVSLFSRKVISENDKCISETWLTNYDIINEKCKIYKSRKCDSITYAVNIEKGDLFERLNFINNSHPLIRQLYNKNFGRNGPHKDYIQALKDNTFQVLINKENDFRDVRREEHSYIFSQLLSDIGGLMGLWLGISIVGIFEIAVFLSYYSKLICRGRKEHFNRSSTTGNIESTI